LTVGTPIATSIQPGQSLFYALQNPGPADIGVSVSGLAAASDVTMLAAPGFVPTDQNASIGSVSAALNVPGSKPGTWYLVFKPNATLNAATPITVSAANLGLTLARVTGGDRVPTLSPIILACGTGCRQVTYPPPPARGNGHVTVTLIGSGFGSDLAVTVVGGGRTYPALAVTRRDSTVAFATFEAPWYCIEGANFPPSYGCLGFGRNPPLELGSYDVEVSTGGATVQLPHAFSVAPNISFGSATDPLTVKFSAPSQLRQGWAGGITSTAPTRQGSTGIRCSRRTSRPT
jgi:hypothetical protein